MTNLTVLLAQPMDFGGGGPDTRIEFVDAKFHVNDGSGILYVVREAGAPDAGNIASFRADEWRAVVRGTIVQTADRDHPQEDPVRRPLSVVRAQAAEPAKRAGR